VVLAMMLGLACGGESERGEPGASSGRGSTGGGGLESGGASGSSLGGIGAAGSSGAEGSSLGGSGAAGAGAQAGRSYVPEDSDVPAAGDGRLTGGSFEGNLGAGWDFCFTKSPGLVLMRDSGGSSDGNAWLAFDSQKSCSESFVCQADGDDAQVGFWLDAPLPPGVPVHLYFDAINLSEASPSGILHFDGLPFDDGQHACRSAAALATIPLSDLALTSDWATRCVSFTPDAVFDVFGLYVTGEAFQLGLDAFRFGPPCGN
jgi:hypothetical protein